MCCLLVSGVVPELEVGVLAVLEVGVVVTDGVCWGAVDSEDRDDAGGGCGVWGGRVGCGGG